MLAKGIDGREKKREKGGLRGRERGREDEEKIKVRGKERKRRKKVGRRHEEGKSQIDDDRPRKLRVSERKTSPTQSGQVQKAGRSKER